MSPRATKNRRRSTNGIVRPLIGDAEVAASVAARVLRASPDGTLPPFSYTTAQAAAALSVPADAVRRDIARRRLRATKVAGAWSIDIEDLIAYGSVRYRTLLTDMLIRIGAGSL